MKTLQALILDDEARARRTLKALVSEFCEAVKIIASVGSVDEAISILSKHSIDIIFLDVSMPEKDGFTLAKRPEFSDLSIIFVTAHSEFAIEAFRVNAVDYLLKPVNINDLRTAIQRVRKKIGEDDSSDQSRLKIFVNNEHLFVTIKDIQYLQADGSYSYVITANDKFIVSRGLKVFEDLLLAHRFFRTHRSFLVNLEYVERVGTKTSGQLFLKDGTEITVSRYRRRGLMDQLKAGE